MLAVTAHWQQRQFCRRSLHSNVSSAGAHYTATSVLQAVTTQKRQFCRRSLHSNVSSAGGHYTATSVLQAVTIQQRQFCRRSLDSNVSSPYTQLAKSSDSKTDNNNDVTSQHLKGFVRTLQCTVIFRFALLFLLTAARSAVGGLVRCTYGRRRGGRGAEGGAAPSCRSQEQHGEARVRSHRYAQL